MKPQLQPGIYDTLLDCSLQDLLEYTILAFARSRKALNGSTAPFVYLGPAELVRYEREKPIRITWRLDHAMPVEMFKENRRGG